MLTELNWVECPVRQRHSPLTVIPLSSQMFPRHVLEHVVSGAPSGADSVASLATSHDSVTIMFMDIVGGFSIRFGRLPGLLPCGAVHHVARCAAYW